VDVVIVGGVESNLRAPSPRRTGAELWATHRRDRLWHLDSALDLNRPSPCDGIATPWPANAMAMKWLRRWRVAKIFVTTLLQTRRFLRSTDIVATGWCSRPLCAGETTSGC